MITIDIRSPIPIPLQITNGFRDLVERRHLKPGDPVPSVRALAKKLVVAPDAVQNAYREALSQGLFEKTKTGYCISVRAPRISDRVPEPLLNLAKSIQSAREVGFNWDSIQTVVDTLRNPKVALPVGALCPYCREIIEKSGNVVQCFGCKTAHHEECWNEVSRCSIFGCGSSIKTAAEDNFSVSNKSE